ncbi:MAG: LuxR C-terminal-related transcriptional regulator [Chloroflexota bacterium]
MERSLPGPVDRPLLRALVVARQPLARAGLRALLTDSETVTVVGQAMGHDDAATLAVEERPDVVVAAWDDGDANASAALAEAIGASGIPLIVIGEAPSPAELAEVLRAGVRGFLLPDATGAEVGAAVEAVARGLLVLDPALASLLGASLPARLADESVAVEALTDREREVLELMALGLANKAIARRLNVTEHTIKFHVGAILAKLGAASRTEAVTRAARRGILAL